MDVSAEKKKIIMKPEKLVTLHYLINLILVSKLQNFKTSSL